MIYQTRKRPALAINRARQLRQADNMAEAILWNELKGRKLADAKFIRQMPIGPYFADFVCRERRLVVEVDGAQHAESDYDGRRDHFMRAQGYSVIRLWNTDVLKDIGSVCATIIAAIEGRIEGEVRTADLRFYPAYEDAMTPHRLAALATSPQRGEETRRHRRQ